MAIPWKTNRIASQVGIFLQVLKGWVKWLKSVRRWQEGFPVLVIGDTTSQWSDIHASNFVIYCHQGQRMAEWQQNANTPPQGQGVERFEPCTLLYLISPLVVLQPYCVTMAGKVYVCNSSLPKGHFNPSTKLNQEIRYKGLPLDVRF